MFSFITPLTLSTSLITDVTCTQQAGNAAAVNGGDEQGATQACAAAGPERFWKVSERF